MRCRPNGPCPYTGWLRTGTRRGTAHSGGHGYHGRAVSDAIRRQARLRDRQRRDQAQSVVASRPGGGRGPRGIVGLADCIVVNRTQGRVSTPKTATADNEVSSRWLEAGERAAGCLTNAAILTAVCDREGDIFHLFANRPAHVHLLIRSARRPKAAACRNIAPRSPSRPARRSKCPRKAKPGAQVDRGLALRTRELAPSEQHAR